jgi:hypothetical protein
VIGVEKKTKPGAVPAPADDKGHAIAMHRCMNLDLTSLRSRRRRAAGELRARNTH